MLRTTVRPLRTTAEFAACVEIQRRIWNHADLDITPVHQFCVSVRTGGILLGAFAGRDLIGYVYSFPAVFGRRMAQHSHHLAVLPEFQGFGLGKTLKWAQREEALARGFDLITWTFDPLQARNANLNLHTLGAAGTAYLENFYGDTPTLRADAGLATDRMFLEWPIASSRVEKRIKAAPAALDPSRRPKAVERTAGAQGAEGGPRRPVLGLTDRTILLEIPGNLGPIRGRGELLVRWQKAIRAAFRRYFRDGWRPDDFIFGERCFYVLRKRGRPALISRS